MLKVKQKLNLKGSWEHWGDMEGQGGHKGHGDSGGNRETRGDTEGHVGTQGDKWGQWYTGKWGHGDMGRCQKHHKNSWVVI